MVQFRREAQPGETPDGVEVFIDGVANHFAWRTALDIGACAAGNRMTAEQITSLKQCGIDVVPDPDQPGGYHKPIQTIVIGRSYKMFKTRAPDGWKPEHGYVLGWEKKVYHK